MDPLMNVALCLVIAFTGVVMAYSFRFLTVSGAIAAFVIAAVVGSATSFWWMFAFLIFPAMGFLATLDYMNDKKARGLQEGQHGERTALNIVGVGLAPMIVALVYALADGRADDPLKIAFISAVAVAVADTIASEIGVADKSGTWMITTGERIEPGPNGGVSRLGLASSMISALVYSALAFVFIYWDFSWLFVIPAVAGMLGNILDSVMGATLENAGKISKYGVNASTQFFGAIIGFLIAIPFV